MSSRNPLAAILGCAGPVLTADERAFFGETDPLGFILFARNVETPDQVRRLVDDLRAAVGRADAPVLIDQEGGRVARLGPPHWPTYPAAARFAERFIHDPDAAIEAAELNARLIARDLRGLGITVDCAPVLDLPVAGADPVIGDRAYGNAPPQVIALGRAVCRGLLDGGVLPVIKHLPGHGRARVDSHQLRPVIDAPWEDMEATDFAPFRALAGMPWAMTAHAVYTAIDPDRPATLSPTLVSEVIRGHMGVDGVLLTDDIGMRALGGDFATRARDALAAGCDIVLHCNGDRSEMAAVARGARPVDADGQRRLAAAVPPPPLDFDPEAARARRESLLG